MDLDGFKTHPSLMRSESKKLPVYLTFSQSSAKTNSSHI